MKKIILSVTAILMALMLTACGMTSEEIETAITQLDSTYQAGTYDKAQKDIKSLQRSYKKMSDEQKNKFDTLKSSVDYALNNADAIKAGLDSAQSFCDKKMYYEAQTELDKLTAMGLPPADNKTVEEKRAVVVKAINEMENNAKFKNIETAYNSGDYNTASSELASIDVSTLSESQNQTYQAWKNSIDAARAKIEAEAKAKAEAAAKAAAGISMEEAKAIVKRKRPGYQIESSGEGIHNGQEVYRFGLEGYFYGEKDEEGVVVYKKTGVFESVAG